MLKVVIPALHGPNTFDPCVSIAAPTTQTSHKDEVLRRTTFIGTPRSALLKAHPAYASGCMVNQSWTFRNPGLPRTAAVSRDVGDCGSQAVTGIDETAGA
jgi:hypothetical protein